MSKTENKLAISQMESKPCGSRTLPTGVRVPHTRVRLGKSKNVIYSTYHHVLELYGPQMPVLVAESLRSMSGKFVASAHMNPENAWAWYVCGRKLLTWHIPSFTDSTIPLIAKEMLLPHSDLAHHANLAYVFSVPNQIVPSCIAVSPEGMIRYWETVGRNSTWIDVNSNLGGEEVCSVCYIPPLGCLAATTSGTMVIITPTSVRGTATVSTRLVTELPGWFGNIGRRVSSIIFGGANLPKAFELDFVKVLTFVRVEGYWTIFLVAGLSLHSWVIQIEGRICNHMYESNLEPVIRKAFPEEIAENPGIELQISDVKKSETGSIVVLVVSSSPRYYLIVELNGDELEPPDAATRMCILSRNNVSVLEGPCERIVPLQFFLLPTTALVYNNAIIYAIPLSGGEEADGEALDVPGGAILGSLMHKMTPVFFCPEYGFVSVTPVDTSAIDVLNTSVSYEQVTPHSIVTREPSTSTTDDCVTQLKMAFIHYIRKNVKQCLQVIRTEFQMKEDTKPVDSMFAKTLVKVSLDIINDLSPNDHRWGPVKVNPKLCGTFSLHLDTQLAEKRRAHNIYLRFAKYIASSVDLGEVNRQGVPVKTVHVIYEHNEKIVACIVVRRLLKRFPKLINRGIKRTTKKMQFSPAKGISQSDFFFRYVSIVDEFMKIIMKRCLKLSVRNSGSIRFFKLLYSTNEIIILILENVIRRRTKKGFLHDCTYEPWLSSKEMYSNLNNLANLNYDLLMKFGRTGTSRCRKIARQFFLLADALLFVRMPYDNQDKFNSLSATFIEFFITFKQPLKALKLSYKYKNFEFLVKLTFALKQHAQINDFIQEFGDEGFCFYLFKYMVSEKKYKELLNLELPERFQGQLESFLKSTPTLHWLYKLKQEDYPNANAILLGMRSNENANLKQQAVMFSLAKLTALVGKREDISKINNNIKIIKAQREIPEELFARKGYDKSSCKMLSPSQLIELYTAEENFEGNEYDFKKALDLLPLVDDLKQRDLLNDTIWKRAIERNNWEGSKSDLESQVEDFFFFKLIQLLKCSGDNYKALIPPVEKFLEEPEFKIFTKDSLSAYLLIYGYEMVMGLENVAFNYD